MLNNNAGAAAIVTFAYDLNGNLTTRTVDANSTSSGFAPDVLNRLTKITHHLKDGNNTNIDRAFDYGYDSVSNRKWVKRDGGSGDAFSYDLGDQVTRVLLNTATPGATPSGTPSIQYDANGNKELKGSVLTIDTVRKF